MRNEDLILSFSFFRFFLILLLPSLYLVHNVLLCRWSGIYIHTATTPLEPPTLTQTVIQNETPFLTIKSTFARPPTSFTQIRLNKIKVNGINNNKTWFFFSSSFSFWQDYFSRRLRRRRSFHSILYNFSVFIILPCWWYYNNPQTLLPSFFSLSYTNQHHPSFHRISHLKNKTEDSTFIHLFLVRLRFESLIFELLKWVVVLKGMKRNKRECCSIV